MIEASPPVPPEPADQPLSGDPSATDAVLARRAQILATEHWGLLAARSTAQSEVLTRITIFLTLVSAGLVTIGLLGQASGFRDWFTPAVLGILAFLCLIGFMTVVRVMNVGEEDMMYVVAMNRLRGAYVDLDPAIERYFLASVTDDEEGMMRTYSFLRRRGSSVFIGSSVMLLFVVDACVFGFFTGAVVAALGGSIGWAVIAGVVIGLGLIAGLGWYALATFAGTWRRYIPLRASTGPPAFWRP
ncbi:hypothetical protein [Microbacterium pygmaeum]|uniref:Uncharacterized protein n=1 Tax=Microbacterium pygmaeum TaxID=370764 RepID=A0A1G8B140_9MICO|nr:hypothetical protein [Microbacterium pygmaeum]SDH26907.1 hypothetical protein SAMN04489810_2556 [Microbacterium pygmaeum]